MLKIDFHLIPVFPVQHLTLYLMFLSIDLFYLHREHNGKVQPAGRRQWKAGVSRGYALRERMRRRLSKTPGASSPRCQLLATPLQSGQRFLSAQSAASSTCVPPFRVSLSSALPLVLSLWIYAFLKNSLYSYIHLICEEAEIIACT